MRVHVPFSANCVSASIDAYSSSESVGKRSWRLRTKGSPPWVPTSPLLNSAAQTACKKKTNQVKKCARTTAARQVHELDAALLLHFRRVRIRFHPLNCFFNGISKYLVHHEIGARRGPVPRAHRLRLWLAQNAELCHDASGSAHVLKK